MGYSCETRGTLGTWAVMTADPHSTVHEFEAAQRSSSEQKQSKTHVGPLRGRHVCAVVDEEAGALRPPELGAEVERRHVAGHLRR